MSRQPLRGAARLLLAGLACGTAGAAPLSTPEQALAAAESAWSARDLQAYLGAWRFPSDEARAEEASFASDHFSSERTELRIEPPVRGRDGLYKAAARAFSVREPRARVEQWLLTVARSSEGWAIVERESVGRIDGLVHLSLDPDGFRAQGLTLRLTDFELRLDEGTLFTSPPQLGPTVLVFVGRGAVRVRPAPAAEQEQLRQFAGRPELVERIGTAFVRIHPAQLPQVLEPYRLEPDPEARQRLSAAQRFYGEQAHRSFLLDADLPGSPWWLLPGLGDAAVTFETRHGTLTFTVSGSEPEDISLFDRARRRQILLYPSSGRATEYDEDAGRDLDVVHHDLTVRFDPRRFSIEAEDRLRFKLQVPTATVRLRLDEDFRVLSIRSPRGGSHLYFRVRHQDALMVSLGPLAAAEGELELTVRYAGLHAPQPVHDEVLQIAPPEPPEQEFVLEDVLVYTNRTVWYPRGGIDDHATSLLRVEVPAGYTAVAGGERTALPPEEGRAVVEYQQDRPGKYISVAVGRMQEMASRQEGSVTLSGHTVMRARPDANRALELAGDILRFYESEFGPCPYPILNLAVMEGVTPGGHSPPGMIVLSVRPPILRRNLRDDPANFSDIAGFFLAHELAHQWWGHGVAGQNYRERWLSEGTAQYAAALWVRRYHGEKTFQNMLQRMARWAVRNADEGPIHLGHRLGHLKGDPQIYRAVVYDKGAYVLHMLRGLVGEEAFRSGLTTFQSRHRYGKAGTADLRRALEEASGRDLGAYFQQWVYATELPELQVKRHTEQAPGGGFRTRVDVSAARLPGPVSLAIALDLRQGRRTHVVTIGPSGGSWTFETPDRPRRVQLNEDRGLLLARVTYT